ncbi:cytochrome P450 [Boletus edulis BED1]|uniref:Cytochrome P450 n=1 Tax=Boletus edulis BED1 TaxID=1328754 RepID=A0AAD4BU41_BOLED|nr:cytochrome P450 [Boletus edulis BED1]
MTWTALECISTSDCLVGLAAATATAYFLYNRYQAAPISKNGIPLPPGPPARWFWENAMPTVNVARTLAHWVTEGSHIIIIIGRVDAVTEIMEKEGSALADRPRMISAGEMLSKDMRLLLLHSGERFRRFRKAAHTYLQHRAAIAYQDIQLEHAMDVITDILDDPKNHRAHAQRYAASVTLRLTYGKSTPISNDDPEFARVHQAAKNFSHVMRPGAYLVDRIPLLKYVPGYGHDLEEYHIFERQLYRDQMNRVQSEMETDPNSESFMKMLLEHTNEHKLSTDEMAYLAGSLFSAGTGTTSKVITHMIMAAACHPGAQKRVQEELDVVTGKDRTGNVATVPTWEDSELLPQVHAFALEVQRWRPVVPIGVAHRATRDIVWRGQCIPAGATVFGCHWAICQDPVAFPEPDTFDPQRWIDDEGRLRNNMTSYPYGYGRRVCPGQCLANTSLYINLALLLWAFRIVERPDAPIDANPIMDSVATQVAPFDVEFVPRIEVGRLKEMMSESGSL